MKKIVAWLLTMVCLLGALCGCGGSVDSATDDKNDHTASDAAYHMTFILSNRIEFITLLEEGMKSIAEQMNIDLTVKDAQGDTSKVLAFVEDAREKSDDAVIVLPVSGQATAKILKAAGEEMKVVIVNRLPSDPETFAHDENVAFVASDERDAGRFQGEYLAKVLKEKGETVARYILLQGTPGEHNTIERSAAALQALRDSGLEVQEAATLSADWEQQVALNKMTPLAGTVDYNCIIANNDSMALGAAEALTAAGLDPAKVPIVGIDATDQGLTAVKDGVMGMTVFQDAYGQGLASIMAAINMIEGKAVTEGTTYAVDAQNDRIVWVPFVAVTPENIASYYHAAAD